MSRSEQEQQFQQEQKIAQIEKCFENIADDYHFLESLGSLDEMDGKPLGNILQKYGVENNTENSYKPLYINALRHFKGCKREFLSLNDIQNNIVYLNSQDLT